MPKEETISSFGGMLRSALGNAIDRAAGDDFLAMCAEDIRFEFPYAPAGSVTQITGRDQLAAYLPKVGALIAFESMGLPICHPSKDGETFVLEFSCKGKGMGSGARYDQDYISVIRVQEAKITHYRDYWNPLILLDAVGGIEALTSNLQEFIHD